MTPRGPCLVTHLYHSEIILCKREKGNRSTWQIQAAPKSQPEHCQLDSPERRRREELVQKDKYEPLADAFNEDEERST
jgi:hypothetical protein